MNAAQVAVKTQQENVTKTQVMPHGSQLGTAGGTDFLQILMGLQDTAQEQLSTDEPLPQPQDAPRPEPEQSKPDDAAATAARETAGDAGSKPAAGTSDPEPVEAEAAASPPVRDTSDTGETAQAETTAAEETEAPVAEAAAAAADVPEADDGKERHDVVEEIRALCRKGREEALTAEERGRLQGLLQQLRQKLTGEEDEPELDAELEAMLLEIARTDQCDPKQLEEIVAIAERVDRLTDSSREKQPVSPPKTATPTAAPTVTDSTQPATQPVQPDHAERKAQTDARTAARNVPPASHQRKVTPLRPHTARRQAVTTQQKNVSAAEDKAVLNRIEVTGKGRAESSAKVLTSPRFRTAEMLIRAQLGEQPAVAVADNLNVTPKTAPSATRLAAAAAKAKPAAVAPTAGQSDTTGLATSHGRGHLPSRAEIRNLSPAEATRKTFQQSFQELVQQARIQLADGRTEIKLALKPEHLGQLRIRLEMKGDSVTARLVTDNPQAKQLLEENLPRLQASLAEQGLEINGFTVDVNPRESGEQQGREAAMFADDGDTPQTGEQQENSSSDSYIKRDYSTVEYVA